MDAPNSVLSLEASFYDKVVVEAIEEYKPDAGLTLAGEISVELGHSDALSIPWVALLTVTVTVPEEGPPPPYSVDMRAVGHFKWEGDAETDPGVPVERVVGINGASLLYSGIREMVAMITGRGPWGPMLLPTVDFRTVEISIVDLDEEEETQVDEEVADA
jgi:preprotein translocase subunit SecB